MSKGGRVAKQARLGLGVGFGLGGALVVVVMVLGVMIGSTSLGVKQVLDVLWGHFGSGVHDVIADQIIWQIRLPRVLLAALIGAALTTAGTVLQALVRNPLADPFILGISSGASVGATAVLLFGTLSSLGLWALSVGSIAGALLAMVTVFVLAVDDGRLTPTRLVLSGVALSAMFSAVASYLLFQGNQVATSSVVFWLLGSFGRASWGQLHLPAISLALAMLYLLSQARALNALSVGAETATALGVDVERLRRRLFVVTSVVAGVAVAVSGVIGFVGLVVPHIVRLAMGNDHRVTLPVGLLWGAAFMVAADLLSRVLVPPQEMPVGVITAFIGGPIFLILIRRRAYSMGGSA
jgi:iron complex transport system permease protein